MKMGIDMYKKEKQKQKHLAIRPRFRHGQMDRCSCGLARTSIPFSQLQKKRQISKSLKRVYPGFLSGSI